MKRLFLIIISVLYFVTVTSAIQVSGDVWGVWNADDNPYEVIGDLRVPPESTLIIEPGCYIDFQGHYKFIIDTSATLQAIGTERDSIIFTAADTAIGWLGLRFYSADSSCSLSYCIIEWGNITYPSYDCGGGIHCTKTNLTVTNCIIQKNSTGNDGGGIYCYSSNITISDNLIISNSSGHGAGIYCWNSQANISNNVFKDNIAYVGGPYEGGGYLAGVLKLLSQKTYLTIIVQVDMGEGYSLIRIRL